MYTAARQCHWLIHIQITEIAMQLYIALRPLKNHTMQVSMKRTRQG